MRALRITAVLALAGAGLAACSSHPAAAKPAASPAVSASAADRSSIVITNATKALAGSLSGVEAGRYGFDLTFPTTHVAGAVDRTDHQAHWTDTMDDQPGRLVQETRVIGQDLYQDREVTGGPNGQGGWRHLDLATAPGSDPLATPDVIHIGALLTSVTATSADGDTIHGTLDLSKFRDGTRDLAMLLAWAQDPPIPVTAQLDDHGRLVELDAIMPEGNTGTAAIPAGPFTLKLTAYGAKVAPAPRPTAH